MIKVGDQVRHEDGTLGTVTHIQEYNGVKLIEWKSCGQRRVSNETTLTIAPPQQYRWRKPS